MSEEIRSYENCTGLSKDPYIAWPCSEFTYLGIILTTIPTVTIMIIIVFGNTLVTIAVLRERRLRQIQNWYIVSLAIADLLVGVLVMPFTLAYELMGVWYFGMILCELWLALDVLVVTASILNMCVISLDRYWAVTNPISYRQKRTPRKVGILIAAAWVLSLLISFPPLLGWRTERKRGQCLLSDSLGYVVYSASGSFFIPVIVLVVVYFRIHLITQKRHRQKIEETRQREQALQTNGSLRTVTVERAKSMPRYRNRQELLQNPQQSAYDSVRRKPTNNYEAGTVTQETASGASPEDSEAQPQFSVLNEDSIKHPNRFEVRIVVKNRKKQLKRQERRSTFILGVILLAFIACWLPFFTMYVLNAFCRDDCKIPILVFDIFFWLGYCNSALNPIIYTIFNREFRQAFKKILHLGQS